MIHAISRLLPIIIATLPLSPLVAQSIPITSQTTAPANKSSCKFDLDSAGTGVSKVEVNSGPGDTWEDKTDSYCVEGGDTSRPEVKLRGTGNIPTGKKIRITVTYSGTSPNQDGPEEWGTKKCD